MGVGGLDLGDGSVQIGDMFLEEGGDCLAHQTRGHVGETGVILVSVLWPPSVAVLFF